jgi:hypothetical protein
MRWRGTARAQHCRTHLDIYVQSRERAVKGLGRVLPCSLHSFVPVLCVIIQVSGEYTVIVCLTYNKYWAQIPRLKYYCSD